MTQHGALAWVMKFTRLSSKRTEKPTSYITVPDGNSNNVSNEGFSEDESHRPNPLAFSNAVNFELHEDGKREYDKENKNQNYDTPTRFDSDVSAAYLEEEEIPLLGLTPICSNVGRKSLDCESATHDYCTLSAQVMNKREAEELEHKLSLLLSKQLERQPLFRGKRLRHRSGKELWASLRTKVLNGTFLTQLSSPSQSNFSSPTEQEQQFTHPTDSDDILIECVLFLVAYLLIGVLGFSFLLESFPIADSLYFTAVTLTSVGYGDVTPTTQQGRLFCCFFALTGVAILGIVLGEIGMRMVEAEVQAVESARKTAAQGMLEVWRKRAIRRDRGVSDSARESGDITDCDNDSMSSGQWLSSVKDSGYVSDYENLINVSDHNGRSILSSTRSLSSVSSSITTRSHRNLRKLERLKSKKRSKHLNKKKFRNDTVLYIWRDMCRVFERYIPAMIPMVFGSIFIAHAENWTYIDAFYYGIVTTTTIGFGDLVPTSTKTKWFAVFLIPLSVGAMGHILTKVAQDRMKRKRESHEAFILEQERQRPLTINDLLIMDDKGEGNLSELDYVTFMLVRMGRVDWETIDELRERFCEWDVRGDGLVDKDDLELMARKKRRGLRGKLQLEEYKRRLINKF